MSKTTRGTKWEFSIPEAFETFLENPPLLCEESRTYYIEIFNAVARDLEPKDMMEWFFTYDLVNGLIESARYGKLKPFIVDTILKRETQSLLLESGLNWKALEDAIERLTGTTPEPTTKATDRSRCATSSIAEQCVDPYTNMREHVVTCLARNKTPLEFDYLELEARKEALPLLERVSRLQAGVDRRKHSTLRSMREWDKLRQSRAVSSDMHEDDANEDSGTSEPNTVSPSSSEAQSKAA